MVEVVRISKEDWSKVSENAFLVAFGETKPASIDRIDFALMAETEGHKPLGFIQCREHDANSVYAQYGGAFHGAIGTSLSFPIFLKGLEYLRARYKRITMRIENKNRVMLKFAAKAGFLIVGVNNYNGQVLVEHMLEFASV